MTFTFEFDHVAMNARAKCLSRVPSNSNIIVQTDIQMRTNLTECSTRTTEGSVTASYTDYKELRSNCVLCAVIALNSFIRSTITISDRGGSSVMIVFLFLVFRHFYVRTFRAGA